MIRAMHTGATGMVGQQFLVDNTANNLANVNTTGFKRSFVNFQDLLYSTLRSPGIELVQGQSTPAGIQVGNGVRVASTTSIFLQGALASTGNELDVAIDGIGFLQFRGPNDRLFYSRDGALRLDSQRNLVNSDGLPLEPQITLPANILSLSIAPDGTVSVVTSDSPNQSQEVGRIQLAQFPNPAGLSREGRNLFAETPASGQPITGEPGQDGLGLLRSSFLESSNVDAVQELVNLILAQRAFEFNSRSVRVSEAMLSTANELVR